MKSLIHLLISVKLLNNKIQTVLIGLNIREINLAPTHMLIVSYYIHALIMMKIFVQSI